MIPPVASTTPQPSNEKTAQNPFLLKAGAVGLFALLSLGFFFHKRAARRHAQEMAELRFLMSLPPKPWGLSTDDIIDEHLMMAAMRKKNSKKE